MQVFSCYVFTLIQENPVSYCLRFVDLNRLFCFIMTERVFSIDRSECMSLFVSAKAAGQLNHWTSEEDEALAFLI